MRKRRFTFDESEINPEIVEILHRYIDRRGETKNGKPDVEITYYSWLPSRNHAKVASWYKDRVGPVIQIGMKWMLPEGVEDEVGPLDPIDFCEGFNLRARLYFKAPSWLDELKFLVRWDGRYWRLSDRQSRQARR